MTILLSPKVLPVLLLIVSNVFMTFAWYGHLKFRTTPLYAAVLFSWSIAFFEYWLAVPANRIGHQAYLAAELKTIQEVVTLSVFAVFSCFGSEAVRKLGIVGGQAVEWASRRPLPAPKRGT